MKKAVFFDRDGTLNKSFIIKNKPYAPKSYKDFQIFPESIEVVRILKKAGYLIVVVTNQPDISTGLISKSELKKMHRDLKKTLDIDEIFHCPHTDEKGCKCRKPKPGMIHKAKKKWGIDLNKSYLVGDQWKDIEAGRSAGVMTILVKRSYSGNCLPHYTVKKIGDVVDIILNRYNLENARS